MAVVARRLAFASQLGKIGKTGFYILLINLLFDSKLLLVRRVNLNSLQLL
jgi:hypothetical protein